MLTLLWPWALLLLPLPWPLRRLLPPAPGSGAPLHAPFFRRWQDLTAAPAFRTRAARERGLLLCLWLLWLLLVAALSRPTWIGDPVALPDSGRDLMLAVDLSGSMRVEDMQVGRSLARRVDAVKAVGAEFIERRQGDRVGLILFGSNAYVQSPLSFDRSTVARFLREAQIGFAGQETAIGDAIGLAVKRLRERPAESRVLVLLTDGRDTASAVDPLDAAKLAAGLSIRVYTIGVGADELEVPGLLGSRFGSRRVNPSAELDEATLEGIAELTGGRYFRARDPQELLAIYSELDRLEPVEQEASTFRPRTALTYVPVSSALALSLGLAAWGTRGTRSRERAPS